MSCSHNNHTDFSYLALGDSYTIGEGIDEKNRYPNILVQELKKHGVNFNKPRIIAKTGWTTDELNDSLNLSVFNTKYDYVSLLIGVNNLNTKNAHASLIWPILIRKSLMQAATNC